MYTFDVVLGCSWVFKIVIYYGEKLICNLKQKYVEKVGFNFIWPWPSLIVNQKRRCQSEHLLLTITTPITFEDGPMVSKMATHCTLEEKEGSLRVQGRASGDSQPLPAVTWQPQGPPRDVHWQKPRLEESLLGDQHNFEVDAFGDLSH